MRSDLRRPPNKRLELTEGTFKKIGWRETNSRIETPEMLMWRMTLAVNWKFVPPQLSRGLRHRDHRRDMRPILIVAIALFGSGCLTEPGPPPPNEGPAFAIFFLENSSLTGYQAAQMDQSQLVLRKEAWLTNDDVQSYDFSSHCIYLKADKSRFFATDTGKHFVFDTVLIDKPFVVVASGEKCYVGSLHSGLLSTLPLGPYIDELDVGFYPEDVLHISRFLGGETDVRGDSRIKDALISLGLYRGGIRLDLESANLLENNDTSTIEYTFRIANIDPNNLCVIDPDKMGTELFHYFTNGVVLQGNNRLYQSEYKKVTAPATSWDPTWFVEIPTGSYIERTAKLKGYPRILPGVYSCQLTFDGPKVRKEDRHLSAGRIWLGNVVSKRIDIELR